MDGQNTFEELKHAVNRVTFNCSSDEVIDFLSNAHRDGFLSNNHYRLLIDDISVITDQKTSSRPKHATHFNDSVDLPNSPTVLNDRFVLGPIIGKGGMGVVYKARDLRKMEVNDKDDVVAIKVLSSELRDLPKHLIALQREAKKAQTLAHPNIVTVYDFDRDGDIAYMTMEYLDGVPLSKIIHARAPLPHNEAIRIIRNISRGLDYAHKHKIVHSDLKPGNIFLLKNGAIKILDFGISRAFHAHDETSGRSIISDTQVFNAFTPAYASCEMIENIPPTPKDDIYALGCIAHELLTGKHPYHRVSADKAKAEKLTVKRTKYLTSNEYRAIKHAVDLDKDNRVDTVNVFLREFSGPKTPLSSLSNHPAKALGMAFIIVVAVSIGIYTANKIKTYEAITAKQAIIVNKFEIENTLKQADKHLKNSETVLQSKKNDALTLYQHVLKLDPDNLKAKSGIKKLKDIYIQHIDNAIKANDLTQAGALLNTLETTFSEEIESQYLKDSLRPQLIAKQIELLFKKANREEADSFYVKPENENAFDTYLEILELAPGEPRAIQGIERIRKSLITETEIKIRNLEWKKAETLIKDALLISPGSKDAVALFNTIRTQRLAEANQHSQVNKPSQTPSFVIANENSKEQLDEDNSQFRTETFSLSRQRLIQLHTNRADKFVNQDIQYGADNNNAAYHFNRILKIDSGNVYAKNGLNKAWVTLMESVNRNLDLDNYSSALKQLEESKNHFSPFYDVNTVINDLLAKREKHHTKTNRSQDIALRLTQAKIQLKAGHWIDPKGNNAMESYLEVQKIDPDNALAKTGLEKIENKFLSLISSSIEKEQSSKAYELLKQALEVFPNSKQLNGLKRHIARPNKIEKQNTQGFNLSKQITALSNKARTALNKKRYIFPLGRSAYDYYSKIMTLDSGNNIGIRGINKTKFLTYEQIDSDIRVKNYQIAYLRIKRLSNLGVHDERFESLQTMLFNADQSYNKAALNKKVPDNHLIYLLKFASLQETNGAIWPPLSNNAYGVYKHVHDIEPLNKTARESLTKLFNNRLSFIHDLLDNNRLFEAERELLALDKLYDGKTEKKLISRTFKELDTLKTLNIQL